MSFGAPWFLAGLALPVLILSAGVLAILRGRQSVHRYEAAGGSGRLARGLSLPRQALKLGLLAAAAALLVIAAARPQWGTEPQSVTRVGADVVIALDVSTSMAANDVTPTRLDRAREEAASLIGGLRGDRVALVIFAGSAYARFPLTTDLPLAQQLVRAQQLNDPFVSPGTGLDAAIDQGIELLKQQSLGARAIIVFSDGEDLTGATLTAAVRARDAGVVIDAVGVGGSGSTIPITDPRTGRISPKIDGSTGQPVVTRLVDSGLRAAAATTGGVYAAVTPDGGDTDAVLAALGDLEASLLATDEQDRPIERFQWFVAAGLLLLLAEMFLAESPSRRAGSRVRGAAWTPLAAGLLLAACTGGVALLNQDGNSLFDRGQYRDALEKYREAQVQRPDLLELHYNVGTTLYRLADYQRAVDELQKVLTSGDTDLLDRAFYTMGNSYVRLGRLQDAVRAYRSALVVAPDDQDAKFNLELIQRRLDSLSPTPSPSNTATATGSPTPSQTASATGSPGASGTPGPGSGSGTPGSGTPGPGSGTPGPSGSGTPGPTGSETPSGSPTGTATNGSPGATATPSPGSGGQDGRQPGNPESPQGDPAPGSQDPDAERRLQELLRELQNPDLSPDDALRLLDAYRAAQAQQDAQRRAAGQSPGVNDW